MANVGYATLTVSPSMRGMQSSMQRQLGGIMPAAGQRAGRQLGAGIQTGTRAGMGRMAGAMGAVTSAAASVAAGVRSRFQQATTAASSGVSGIGSSFRSMAGIAAASLAAIGLATFARDIHATATGAQDTRAVLEGMYDAAGHGAGEAQKMTRLLNDEFGRSGIAMTAFQQGAQDLAYLGLNAQESTDLMKLLEATISATGGSAEDLESVTGALQSIQNRGKATMQELNVISQRGVPIMDMLADRLGVDVPEAMQMVTDGAVDINDVLGAMEDRGGTWANALMDSADNLNRTFSGAWDSLRNTVINGIANQLVPLLDKLAPQMIALGDRIGSAFEALPQVISRAKSTMDRAGVADALADIYDGATRLARGALPALSGVVTGLGIAFGAMSLVLAPVFRLLGRLGDWMSENEGVVKAFGVAVGVAVGALGALKAALAIGGAIAALSNPIGWVVLAIGLLAAGLKAAWDNSETFRDIVSGAFDRVRTAASSIVSFFTERVWPVLRDGWSELSEAAGPVVSKIVNWLSDMRSEASAFQAVWGPLWEGAKRNFQIFWDAVGPIAEGALEQLKGVFEVFSGILEGDWDKTWKGVKRILRNGLKNLRTVASTGLRLLWNQFKTWFVDLPSSIRDWLAENGPVIASTLKEWGQAFIDWVVETTPKVIEKLQELGQEIADWIVEDLPPLMIEKFTELWEEHLKPWLEDLPEKIKTAINNASNVQEWFTEWGPKIVAGLGLAIAFVVLAIPALFALIGFAIQTVITEILLELRRKFTEKLGEMMEAGSERVSEGVDGIVGWFRTLPGRATAYVQNLHQRAMSWLGRVRDGLSQRAQAAVNGVVNFFRTLPGRAAAFLQDLHQRAVSLGGRIASSLGNAARNARDRVVNGFQRLRDGAAQRATSLLSRVRQIPGQVRSALSDAGNWLYTTGRNIITGLINGVTSRATALYNRLKSIARNALQSAKDTLDISSPSKVFRDEVGAEVIAGLLDGVDQGAGDVDAAMADMARRLVPPTTRVPASAEVRGHATAQGGGSQADLRRLLETLEALEGRDIVVQVDSQEIARATQRGDRQLARR